jgi:Flp pilus assembly protein TadG
VSKFVAFKPGNVRAQALVEFALASMLLVLLLFAIIQYGMLFAAYITVRNASSIGARAAVTSQNNLASTNDAVALARSALGPMLKPNLAQISLQTTNVAGAPAWSMTVNYPLPLIVPFVVPGGGTNRTLSATTIAR